MGHIIGCCCASCVPCDNCPTDTPGKIRVVVSGVDALMCTICEGGSDTGYKVTDLAVDGTYMLIQDPLDPCTWKLLDPAAGSIGIDWYTDYSCSTFDYHQDYTGVEMYVIRSDAGHWYAQFWVGFVGGAGIFAFFDNFWPGEAAADCTSVAVLTSAVDCAWLSYPVAADAGGVATLTPLAPFCSGPCGACAAATPGATVTVAGGDCSHALGWCAGAAGTYTFVAFNDLEIACQWDLEYDAMGIGVYMLSIHYVKATGIWTVLIEIGATAIFYVTGTNGVSCVGANLIGTIVLPGHGGECAVSCTATVTLT